MRKPFGAKSWLSPVLAVLAAGVLMGPASSGAAPTAQSAQSPEYTVPVLPLQYLTPFPILHYRVQVTKTGARLTLLRIEQIPSGARVTVKCSGGRKRGCPFKSKSKLVAAGRSRVRFQELERRLKAGVVIRIYARRGQTIGKYARLTIRKRRLPKFFRACVLPGDPNEPQKCP